MTTEQLFQQSFIDEKYKYKMTCTGSFMMNDSFDTEYVIMTYMDEDGRLCSFVLTLEEANNNIDIEREWMNQ